MAQGTAASPAIVTDSSGVQRLAVDLEASDLDVGGVHLIQMTDRQNRRIAEYRLLQDTATMMETQGVTERASSNLRGFEVR